MISEWTSKDYFHLFKEKEYIGWEDGSVSKTRAL